MSKDFNDFALRLPVFLTVACHLNDYLMSTDCPLRALLRNKDIRTELRIVRHGKAERLTLFVGADNLLHTTLKNLDNGSLSPSSGRYRRDCDLNRIHMHRTIYLRLRNKDVLRLSFH